MPRFEAVDEFLDEDLILPIKGADGTVRDYRIPHPSLQELLRIKAFNRVAQHTPDNQVASEADVAQVALMSDDDAADLGLTAAVREQMVADDISVVDYQRAISTALLFRLGSTDQAKAVWSGKATNPKIRSAKAGGVADATTPASTSGTSTRKKSPKR